MSGLHSTSGNLLTMTWRLRSRNFLSATIAIYRLLENYFILLLIQNLLYKSVKIRRVLMLMHYLDDRTTTEGWNKILKTIKYFIVYKWMLRLKYRFFYTIGSKFDHTYLESWILSNLHDIWSLDELALRPENRERFQQPIRRSAEPRRVLVVWN